MSKRRHVRRFSRRVIPLACASAATLTPTSYSANLHHIRHHKVGCVRFDGVLHVQCSPPVLSALNWSPCFARDERVPGVVVGDFTRLTPVTTAPGIWQDVASCFSVS